MSPHSPYVGARPFDTADAAIFYGRSGEAAALAGLWRDRPITVLHGPAGVGKTSLLRAGLLPKLRSDHGLRILPIGRLSFAADFPLAALPDLNPLSFALLTSWFPAESPIRVSGSSIRRFLRKRYPVDRNGHAGPLLAAIDQADLLFPGSDRWERHRVRLAAELVEALVDCRHLRLLLAVRTEHLEELLDLLTRAGLAPGTAVTFRLDALSPSAAREAVSGPLGRMDHPLATGARRLVADLGRDEPAVDPALLQIVCSRLWDELRPGHRAEIPRLSRAVDQVLAEHCLQALTEIAADHGEMPGVLVEWFRDTFGRRKDAAAVSAGEDTDSNPPDAVLRALQDVHLLQAEQQSGRVRYRLRLARLRAVARRLDSDAAERKERPRLDAAEAAFTIGELGPAWNRAQDVAEDAGGGARVRAAARCLLGTIAYDQGRIDSAIDHYEAAIEAYGALGDTGRVGMLLAAVGRLKIGDGSTEAVNRLRAALIRLPGDLFVKTALAHALWYAGRTQAAIAVLDDALSQDGGTSEALRLRGELLADLNRAESALRDLDRIDYTDRPSSRAAWALARRAHAGIGPAASEELELVDSADDSGPALLRVARVLRLEGETHTAAGLAARAIRARRPPLPRHLRKEAERLMTP